MERGRDRISGLPNDLLHGILLRLHSVPAAARTSVLSRRWRRVWAHLPELVLGGLYVPGRPSSFLRSVDAALAAYSAPTVSVLGITVPDVGGFRVPARSAASWLRFASARVAGTLSLTVPPCITNRSHELELPPCGRATSITLSLGGFLFRLRPAGLFAALTDLTIQSAGMEGRELGAFVSSMCPRLRDLTLLATLVAGFDVSIRSASLKHLKFHVGNTERLEVAAPTLEVFVASSLVHAHISAPKLAEAEVHGLHRYKFADAGPHRLRRLDITQCYVNAVAPPRMRRFNAVDELRLRAFIGMEGYNNFLDDANNLPMCQTLSVCLTGDHHGFVPIMLQLLRRGNGIRKLVLETYPKMKNPCLLACLCRLPESYRADNIALDSLEEIEINSFTGADDQMEFLKLLLSRCNATKITSVEINKSDIGPSPSEDVAEKIRSISRPNLRVRLHVISNGRISELVL